MTYETSPGVSLSHHKVGGYMKTSIAVIVLSFLLIGGAWAQERNFSTELSFSGTGGWVSTTRTMGGQSSSSDAQGYATLAARCGYYVYEGLSIEPEVALTAMEGTEPAHVLAANVSYTFFPASSTVCPFVLGGVGISNAMPLGPNPIGKTTDAMDVFMLDAGAGVKVFLAESAALRFEYRYQRFSYDYEYITSYYPTIKKSTMDYAVNMHRLFIGVSIFI